MKIEVLQEELIKTLNLVSKAVANRPQLAVLSNLLIEARKDGLRMQATDLEIGMEVRLAAKVIEEGKITVPARTLTEFVGSLTPGKVEIELDKETLKVKSGQYRGKFQVIAADEFPVLPENETANQLGELEIIKFTEASQLMSFAVAKDSLRPVLTGILLEFGKKKMEMVATDGFRLAKRAIEYSSRVEEEVKLLVPARAIAEISRIESEGTIKISHIAKSNQVVFEANQVRLVTQLIEGNYPDYNKIIPQDYVSEVKVGREELLQAVKAAHIFARENSNMMRWSLSESELTVKAETPERGGAEVGVEVKLEGDGGEVVFNTKFVLDYLGVSGASEITFGMGEHLAPCAFTEEGNKDFLYVVMPINA